MLTLSNSATLSASRPALNLSTGAGNLTTATIGRPYQDTTNNECYGNLCAAMGIPCQCDDFSTEPMKALNQQLLATTHHLLHPNPIVTTLADDKNKSDGDINDPHNDIQANGGGCGGPYDTDDTTVKTTQQETIQQWINWSYKQ